MTNKVTTSPLRLARISRKLSQGELGKLVGVTSAQIHRIEKDGIVADTALRLVETLKPDVKLTDLLSPLKPLKMPKLAKPKKRTKGKKRAA